MFAGVFDIKVRYCLTAIALWDTTFPSNRKAIFGLSQIVRDVPIKSISNLNQGYVASVSYCLNPKCPNPSYSAEHW